VPLRPLCHGLQALPESPARIHSVRRNTLGLLHAGQGAAQGARRGQYIVNTWPLASQQHTAIRVPVLSSSAIQQHTVQQDWLEITTRGQRVTSFVQEVRGVSDGLRHNSGTTSQYNITVLCSSTNL